MRLVPARYNTDCGVSSFATLMNLTWEEARELLHPNRRPGSTYDTGSDEWARAAKSLNLIYHDIDEPVDIASLKHSAILILKCGYLENKAYRHYYHGVVWDAKKKRVLDGSTRKRKLATYQKWIVGYVYFTPNQR